MKNNWIDFKTLRANLDLAQVMEQYKVDVKRKGDQHMGYCPLPDHNGKRNSPSFSANLERGIFQCFGCGAKGNVIDFAAYMENLDPENGRDLRRIAVKLRDKFAPDASVSRTHNPKGGIAAKPETPLLPAMEELVNCPLD